MSLPRIHVMLGFMLTWSVGCGRARIPMSDVYTVAHPGPQPAMLSANTLRAIQDGESEQRACMIAAEDLDAAQSKSVRILFGVDSNPSAAVNGSQLPAWIFVFFGGGPSSPPGWTIDYVKRTRDGYKIAYRTPEPLEKATRDVRYYMAWISVRYLPPGRYVIQLLDRRTLVTKRWVVEWPLNTVQQR